MLAYIEDQKIISMGQRIRELRESAGLSLRELAKKSNISAPFLSDVELGRRYPTDEKLAIIALNLDAPIDSLKKHDHRSSISDLRRLVENSPSLGAAVSILMDQVESGTLTTDELAAKLRSISSKRLLD